MIQNIFWPNKFFPQFFFTLIFWSKIIFSSKFFFDPQFPHQIFLGQIISWPKNIFDKSFWPKFWDYNFKKKINYKLDGFCKLFPTTWPCHGFALDPTKYLLNIKVSNLVTTCWSLQGNANEFSVYVDLTYTGIPRISGPEIRGIQIQE